ncbi:MAG: hypothetical protein ACI9S8_001661 [Chlamydiales bacterium]
MRFQLLSTPPHGDAVTFSCKIATFLEEDSHLSYRIPSQAHCRDFVPYEGYAYIVRQIHGDARRLVPLLGFGVKPHYLMKTTPIS